MVIHIQKYVKTMNDTRTLIEHHYGIENKYLLTIDTSFRREELAGIYLLLGQSVNDQLILDCLATMTALLEENGLLGRSKIERAITEDLIRRETLKLLVFSRETRNCDTITIHSSTSKVKFVNYSDWMRGRLLEPFFKAEEIESISPDEAKTILRGTRKKAGRTPPDPRTQPLLLGTYELITSLRDFPSPMPNNLCEFLQNLLTFWGALPENPVIDPMWIRAQLRYLRRRKKRPDFGRIMNSDL